MKLEGLINTQREEYKLTWEKEKGEMQNQIKQKDIIIADLKEFINTMQTEISAKNKEILLVKQKYEEEDFTLAFSFNVLALDTESDIEQNKLHNENTQLQAKLNEAINQIQEHQKLKQQITVLEEEYQKKIKELEEKHEVEIDNKDVAIKKLEGANSVLESKAFQLIGIEKVLRQKIESSNAVITQVQKELTELEANKNEMKNEIKVLILKCKEHERALVQKDLYIKKQQEAITEFNNQLERAKIDTTAMQQQNIRLSNLLKEKKDQLNAANMKIRELKTSVVADYKDKLEESVKTIEILKEILRGHNAELKVKKKDIMELKKNLGKVKSVKQVNEVVNITQIETNKKELQEEVCEAESPIKTKQSYKENYMKKIEEYFNKLHDINYRNNSSNIRNVLYYPFVKKEVESRSKSLLLKDEQAPVPTNNGIKIDSVNQSEGHNREFDINEIIRKSIHKGGIRSNERNAKSKFKLAQQVDINGSPIRNRRITNKRLIFT